MTVHLKLFIVLGCLLSAASLCDAQWCSSETEGSVRLVGGSSKYEGRVEICYSNEWGTICDNTWDRKDASVVCKELGYTTATTGPYHEALGSAHFGSGSGPIWLDRVYCYGSESRLEDCLLNYNSVSVTSTSCYHRKDAGVRCAVGVCATYQWRCDDGECVYSHNRCNGYTQCSDESDERNCSGQCQSAFPCDNGQCIPFFRCCDGTPDCSDGSDEGSMCYEKAYAGIIGGTITTIFVCMCLPLAFILCFACCCKSRPTRTSPGQQSVPQGLPQSLAPTVVTTTFNQPYVPPLTQYPAPGPSFGTSATAVDTEHAQSETLVEEPPPYYSEIEETQNVERAGSPLDVDVHTVQSS